MAFACFCVLLQPICFNGSIFFVSFLLFLHNIHFIGNLWHWFEHEFMQTAIEIFKRSSIPSRDGECKILANIQKNFEIRKSLFPPLSYRALRVPVSIPWMAAWRFAHEHHLLPLQSDVSKEWPFTEFEILSHLQIVYIPIWLTLLNFPLKHLSRRVKSSCERMYSVIETQFFVQLFIFSR